MQTGIDRKRLSDILARFQGAPMLVVGDVILDRYVWGSVDRISPEAPVVVVHVNKEDARLGGAANVVQNLSSLGAKSALCGVVGTDDAGKMVRALLDELGAEHGGLVSEEGRTTTIKTRVIAQRQQIVRIDRELVRPLETETAKVLADHVESRFAGVKSVVVSDYGKGAVGSQIFDRIDKGYKAGLLGAGKIPVIVDPKSPHFDLYTKATIIKPNRKEAEEAAGRPIPNRAAAVDVARLLLERWKCQMVLITLGDEGMVLVSNVPGDEPVLEVDTEAREVFDVSGAGDTVSAVFALALGVGASPREAGILSNIAAGIVVGEVGTVPIRFQQLQQALR